MSPKFSVIIATYNSAHTLSKAIDSVLEQSYLAYEIVIVDDGSTDDTFLVVSNYGDKVRYHLQGNSGVSAARNKGAEMARGDWLAFLDADDWYYPQRLYWHAELLVRHVKLDFLIGDYCYVREDGSVIRRSIQSNPYGRKVLASADEYASVLLGGCPRIRYSNDHLLMGFRKNFNYADAKLQIDQILHDETTRPAASVTAVWASD